jgi:hypothetical protein
MRMFESLRRLKSDIVEMYKGTMNGVCIILLQPSELELLWMKKSPDLECITMNKEVGERDRGKAMDGFFHQENRNKYNIE